MINDIVNELVISDLNNCQAHKVEFNEMCSLYDDEIFVIDIREISRAIAERLADQHKQYGWDEVEPGDFDCTMESELYDVIEAIKDMTAYYLDEEGIEYTLQTGDD